MKSIIRNTQIDAWYAETEAPLIASGKTWAVFSATENKSWLTLAEATDILTAGIARDPKGDWRMVNCTA